MNQIYTKRILHNTRSAKEPGYKAYHTKVTYDIRSMTKISADIKWMPLSNQGFNYILLTHDNSVQQMRQNRTFPRNQTFAVGDLVFLFAASAVSI